MLHISNLIKVFENDKYLLGYPDFIYGTWEGNLIKPGRMEAQESPSTKAISTLNQREVAPEMVGEKATVWDIFESIKSPLMFPTFNLIGSIASY